MIVICVLYNIYIHYFIHFRCAYYFNCINCFKCLSNLPLFTVKPPPIPHPFHPSPLPHTHTHCSLWLLLFTSLVCLIYINYKICQSKFKLFGLHFFFMISLFIFYFRFKVFASKNQNLTDNPNFGIQKEQMCNR